MHAGFLFVKCGCDWLLLPAQIMDTSGASSDRLHLHSRAWSMETLQAGLEVVQNQRVKEERIEKDIQELA